MKRNVGGADRVLRGVVAAALFAVAYRDLFREGPSLGPLLAIVAGIGLTFNVVSGRCLGNRVLGIDTCRDE
ncbi:YgaP family membrane protein [Natronorarus salvus]|uniref:YgaP family membrane protein n=1 Tax=Natronorarus salvus TaxID=3117733 RepID=UPI002F2668C3